MYLSALEFLDEERDAWRPFEAHLELTDEDRADIARAVASLACQIYSREHCHGVARPI